MADYQTLYHILFNAITDAIRDINSGKVDLAENTLKVAQQRTEELYIRNEI